MRNWGRRRQVSFAHDQEAFSARSDHRWPSHENRNSTVPLWEKKFCSAASSFSWNKFLENKRYVYLYTNILEWDDSAGKEAFDNAKSRFRSMVKNLPCNVPLPDPELHIDAVDWDAAVDHELYLDLEKNPVLPEENNDSSLGEQRVFLSEALLRGMPLSSSGWGDTEPQVEAHESANVVHFGQGFLPHEEGVFSSKNGWGETDNLGATWWGFCSDEQGHGVNLQPGSNFCIGGAFSSNNNWGESKAFGGGSGWGAWPVEQERNFPEKRAFSSNNAWGESEALGGGSGWGHGGRSYGEEPRNYAGRGASSTNYGTRNRGSGSNVPNGYRGRRKNEQGAAEKHPVQRWARVG